MINSGKYMNYIIEKLSIIRYEIISKNKLNLTDDNIVLENFICKILNLTYDYNLINLNCEVRNFPGIDLGDKSQKLGIQVTSDKSGKKVKSTLKKYSENKCYEKYNHLKFFILSQKQTTYSKNINSNLFQFSVETDILDFDDLYRDILYTSIDTRRKICEYIDSEIVEVMSSLEVDYYDQYEFKRLVVDVEKEDWNNLDGRNYQVIIKHCFGYIPFHIDVLVNGFEEGFSIYRNEQEIKIESSNSVNCKVMIS